VVRTRTGLARLSKQILTIRALGHRIIIPEQAASAKLRNEKVDDVFE
jgi:hypothetical protein